MAQTAWMDHAWAELGQREIAGTDDNARIMALYRELGDGDIAHDEVAWCAAFVGATLQRGGVASTQSLLARSYLGWGEPLAQGRLGAVAVFSRGGDTTSGHVAFYLDEDDARVFVLGGNQGDAVTVTAMARDRLLGLRWPQQAFKQLTAQALVTTIFEHALKHVLEMEGGWTEDPYDPGGPTNFGITLATFGAHRRVQIEASTIGELKQALRQITSTEVQLIYQQRYWTTAKADVLPPALALMHFDAAVNHGVGTAARILQECVGVAVDGEIGPQTLDACAHTPIYELLQRYAEARRARYRALGHFWRFGRGWLARVERTLERAQSLASEPSKFPTTTGVRPMTDIKAAAAADSATPGLTTDAKWWGQSLTVWGTIITAASTVLPVLGPLIGLDITGEMIRQLGAQGVQVVQALGGLAGSIMAVYGRFRATTRLERRAVTLQL